MEDRPDLVENSAEVCEKEIIPEDINSSPVDQDACDTVVLTRNDADLIKDNDGNEVVLADATMNAELSSNDYISENSEPAESSDDNTEVSEDVQNEENYPGENNGESEKVETTAEQPCEIPSAAEESENSADTEESDESAESEKNAENAEQNPEDSEESKTESVTEYTASLWKYTAIADDVPEPSPEYYTRSDIYDGGKVIGARVRGKKHKHEGTCCDDWFETASLGDITFIAVADGAGSKKLSRIGSQESCRAAVGFLKDHFEKNIVNDTKIMSGIALDMNSPDFMSACKTLAEAVRGAVNEAYLAVKSAFYCRAFNEKFIGYMGRSLDIRDFSATLLISVVIPLGNEKNEKLVVSCQIGDGMIALIDTSAEFSASVKRMGDSDSGEFSGETEFLTTEKMRAPESIALKTRISRGNSDILMMMTDGVSDDYFPVESQMHRLYFDLAANGILPPRKVFNENSTDEWQDKLPEPSVYPWVNDKSVMVAANYTNKICRETGLTFENIWNAPEILEAAAAKLGDFLEENAAERLKVWLDNYVERGSFDDRTLVIAII